MPPPTHKPATRPSLPASLTSSTDPSFSSANPSSSSSTATPSHDVKSPTTNGSTASIPRTIQSDEVTLPSTGNRIRDKCIELLYQSLAVDATADGERILDRAMKIEQLIFEDYRQASDAYRSKIRSYHLRLKGTQNPGLRHGLVSGELSALKLCSMSEADMKTGEQLQRERELHEKNLFEAQGAQPARAATEMFRCSKCKQRKCTYYQMQTRSADEPMTTFVTCTVCGNRWKFC